MNYYSQFWTGSAWRNNERSVFVFDGNRRMLQRITQSWSTTTSSWANNTKTDNTYNAFGSVDLGVSLVWSTTLNAWQNSSKNENIYDPAGFQLSYDGYYSWNTTTSAYDAHIRYEYICARSNVGITDISEANKFSIYSNPVSGNFMTINSVEKADYALIDITGKLLQSGDLGAGETRIDINLISAGVYFVKVGNQTKKIIVQ